MYIFDSSFTAFLNPKICAWEIGASLPTNLRMTLGESVSLELDTDKPYIYHADHVKQYPPRQGKDKSKKNNKKG